MLDALLIYITGVLFSYMIFFPPETIGRQYKSIAWPIILIIWIIVILAILVLGLYTKVWIFFKYFRTYNKLRKDGK